MAADGVIGRDEELAAVGALLESPGNAFAALVLVGQPGVGKTTLWRAGIESARERSVRVLVASPAEAETSMSFAALGDLLAGVHEEALSALPPPQRQALEVALLLAEAEDPGPDHHAVAVAFLTALRALAAEAPVVVAVDDVQWLDSASAAVLGFAARRLGEESVLLLLAERAPSFARAAAEVAGDRLESVAVGPLSLGAVHQLLHERLAHPVPRPLLRRIHETSGGNPFYALEIARALDTGQLSSSPGERLPIPPSLDELVRGRIEPLPADTRSALAVCAALGDPRLPVVSAALGADAAPLLAPALEARLIELEGDRIRFAHPLLASAAYGLADPVEQRGMHRRLAAAVKDVEERSRHLALATDGPDAEVAGSLELAAAQARARGAAPAAAELSESARRLTPPELRAELHRRGVTTAGYRFLAGDTAGSRELLQETVRLAVTGQERAEALVMLARVDKHEGSQVGAAELLRSALEEAGVDDQVRAEAAQGYASTLFYLREDLEEALRYAALAVDLAARAGAVKAQAEALADRSLLEATLGRSEAPASLSAAIALVTEPTSSIHPVPLLWYRGYVDAWSDRADEAAVLARQCLQDARARGGESALPILLASLATAEYLAGRWDEAARAADEGLAMASQTGQRPQQAWSFAMRALVRASLGLEGEARADADAAFALMGERGMGVARIHALWALGLLELSLDRPAETASLLAPERERLIAAGVREPGSIRFVPDEVEAMVTLGRLDDAERLLDWLEERGRALDRASALAAGWRCRGLLLVARGDGPGGLAAFERALAEHERVSVPFERARTLLALGAALRRAKRKREARETLGEALAAFERLGAAIWAGRARRELERISGRAPSRGELTPTERRVVELVAEGRTNQEVAGVLVVSPRTVEFHLRNVFRKLGVHSRAELVRRFASPVN